MYRSVAAAWESIRTALADCMPGPHFLATRQRYRRIPYGVKYFAVQSRCRPQSGLPESGLAEYVHPNTHVVGVAPYPAPTASIPDRA